MLEQFSLVWHSLSECLRGVLVLCYVIDILLSNLVVFSISMPGVLERGSYLLAKRGLLFFSLLLPAALLSCVLACSLGMKCAAWNDRFLC